MDNIRLGIIGCGIMGERILRVALENDDLGVTLSGVYEPDVARRDRLAEMFTGLVVPGTREALIEMSDCVYIASPPLTHLEHARAAMAAGRAVLTEKPLAVAIGDSEAFLELSSQPGNRAAVNFIFASAPGALQVLKWLGEGVIGTPERLEIGTRFARWPREWQEGAASWLSGPDEGGFTREVVSHFLFLTRRAFGPLSLQSSTATPGPEGQAETAISADLVAGGLPVRLMGDVGETEEMDHNIWRVVGDKGSIRLRDWSFAERWDPEAGEWQGDPDAPSHAEMRPLILRGQVGKLPALVRGEPQDLATVAEALEVQRIVEAILSGQT